MELEKRVSIFQDSILAMLQTSAVNKFISTKLTFSHLEIQYRSNFSDFHINSLRFSQSLPLTTVEIEDSFVDTFFFFTRFYYVA